MKQFKLIFAALLLTLPAVQVIAYNLEVESVLAPEEDAEVPIGGTIDIEVHVVNMGNEPFPPGENVTFTIDIEGHTSNITSYGDDTIGPGEGFVAVLWNYDVPEEVEEGTGQLCVSIDNGSVSCTNVNYVDEFTSVSEFENVYCDAVTLYPNPATTNDVIIIETESRTAADGHLSIYNMQGQKVLSHNHEEVSYDVDTYTVQGNTLKPGIYICIISGKRFNYKSLLIVN